MSIRVLAGGRRPDIVAWSVIRIARRAIGVGLAMLTGNMAFAADNVTYPLPAPVYLTGTASATITVVFGVAPPAGSSVSCSLSLISNDPRAPSDTQNASVTTTGGASVICPLTLNYRWRLTTPASDTMTIAYSVQGPTQSSSGIVNIIPMPADGYVANMAFTVNQ